MRFETPEGPQNITIEHAIVAGWTGRDAASVDHHIAELAALGVAPPSEVPLFYRVSASLLTRSETIQVLGTSTSGEVEPLLVRSNGKLWIGLASDHTDRDLEAYSVAASKQACAKPVSKTLWAYEDVAEYVDELTLRCQIDDGGAWVTYQNGTLAAIRPLQDLAATAGLSDGTAMLCGTLPAIGGVRPAKRYRMALVDPVRSRTIRIEYRATPLRIVV